MHFSENFIYLPYSIQVLNNLDRSALNSIVLKQQFSAAKSNAMFRISYVHISALKTPAFVGISSQ
jgi:hypothetical protein